MPVNVPPIDPDLAPDQDELRLKREQLEFELLEAEAKLKHLAHREIGQRYIIKWVAVACGLLVTIGMVAMMWHLVHSVFWGPFLFASSAFSVAIIVAPILSITTITVALFIGAFPKFEDKDLESIRTGAAGMAKVFRST